MIGANTTTLGSDTRLVNLSSRAFVGSTAEAQLIPGFVVGDGPLDTLIRGIGPGLIPFNVNGVLSDPTLTLSPAPLSALTSNDNWGRDGGATAEDFNAVGAFALPADSLDAALSATLDSGSTTAVVSGPNSGVALAELYLSDTGSGATARLLNLSTRALVSTGERVLVGGFILEGNSPRRCLVRAVGPTLADFDVGGPLADPTLQLFRGSPGELVAENDDWSLSPSATAIATAADRIGAFDLRIASTDAALLVTLEPGSYTAVVSGVDGAEGVALVEVYVLDD